MSEADRVEKGDVKLPNAGLIKQPTLALPTRIITYAWGEKYIRDLTSMTLPALLAPGNLPFVAGRVPCELVILSEEASFPRFRAEPVIRRLEALCPVRFVALDDLISVPDQYGIALTHVLHRGFSDLASAMTDAWLIFLNADFVVADGSLKNLLRLLQAGERLVAAPSYCVNAEESVPELLARLDPQTQALALPPREMAELILDHRHNTIRAKTVNRSTFGIQLVDQFYWMHDGRTLLGHQMPVAIVGMRPERHVAEPNSYWDHGLMREYCPTVEHCVIGDSDEFLMLELRSAETAREQLDRGSSDPAEIARNAASFLTSYQRDMASYPLTLHADDLPADIDLSRRALRTFVESVLSHTPAILPSHIGHPQWTYHWARFTRSRHGYLSRQLGLATEKAEPPASFSEIECLWWRLDGCKKTFERERGELEYLRDSQIAGLLAARDRLDKAFHARQFEIGAQVPAEFFGLQPKPAARAGKASGESSDFFKKPLAARRNSDLSDDRRSLVISENARDLLALRQSYEEEHRLLTETVKFVHNHYEEKFAELTTTFETARARLQFQYDRALGKPVKSALVPHVLFRQGPLADRDNRVTLMRRFHRILFGKFPRVQKTSPFWPLLRHVLRIVDQAASEGAANVLVVVGGSGVPNRFADGLPGTHAEVALGEAIEGNLPVSLGQTKFDLCVCDLAIAELATFGELARMVAPSIRAGGKIVGFCPNLSMAPITIENKKLLRDVAELPGTTIHYSGSERSARVLRWFRAPGSPLVKRSRVNFIVGAARMIALAPGATMAAWAEQATTNSTSAGRPWTSITVEINV
jgi:hypothetical protein